MTTLIRCMVYLEYVERILMNFRINKSVSDFIFIGMATQINYADLGIMPIVSLQKLLKR